MRYTNNYQYRMILYPDADTRKSVDLKERQECLYTIDECTGNGNTTDEVPFYNKGTASVSFNIESVIGDFIAIGNISDNEDERFLAKWVESLRKDDDFAKTETPDEYRRKINRIPILHTDFPVVLSENWNKNPIFLPEREITQFVVDQAKETWRMVYRIIMDTCGLSYINLGDFNILCSQYHVKINCDICNSTPKPAWEISHSPDDGITYHYECTTSREIAFSLLHFMISNHMILKECRLCGKYFVPEKPQENFCRRKFSYTDWSGEVKEYESCKVARKMIKQRLWHRRETINEPLYKKVDSIIKINELETEEDRDYAYHTYPAYKMWRDFHDPVIAFETAIKKNPSIFNFMEYERYLYIDCETYYKRYERRRDK